MSMRSGGDQMATALLVFTPEETANRLKVSLSWLAKARIRGDGPPFIKIGRAIRYSEAASSRDEVAAAPLHKRVLKPIMSPSIPEMSVNQWL
jgi:hypothetical protein